MPLLGDALEESGLDDAGVLTHCRALGPHATSSMPFCGSPEPQ
jgi:hypothetical protein